MGETLKKEFTFWPLVMFALFGGLGTGILFSPLGVISVAGPASFLAWIIGAIGFLFIAYTMSEISFTYPEAGGPARYSLYTHGESTHLLLSFANLIYYLLVAPIEALAVVEALNYFSPVFIVNGAPTYLGAAVGVILILVFIPFNYFGVKRLSQSTTAFSVVKLILFLGVSLGLVFVYSNLSNFSAYGGFAPHGSTGIFQAIPIAMFAFSGLRFIPDFAEEIKNKNIILKAILVVIGLQTILFLLFNFAMLGGINWAAFGLKPGDWSSLSSISGNPFIFAASSLHQGWLLAIAVTVGIVSPFVAGYAYLGGGTRVLFSMGRSHFVHSSMKTVSDRYSIPYVSLITFGIIGIIITFITAPIPTIYGIILDITAIGYVGFASIPISMMASRRQRKSRIKMPGGSIAAPIAFVFSSLVVFWSGWPSVPYALILLAISAGIFGVKYKVKGQIVNSFWLIGYLIWITAMTYFSSDGALKLISFDLGTILVVAVSAIVFYPWGIFSATALPYSNQDRISIPVQDE
ncbi:MAG: APC family permease [Candidatus Thermoplasmatota archaeon]|nr:APC family permease [Candidatus Thermoplasmatota archaeon]MCL5252965.1 APC family permease [Candidatus Thermoplasmatota archaeon]